MVVSDQKSVIQQVITGQQNAVITDAHSMLQLYSKMSSFKQPLLSSECFIVLLCSADKLVCKVMW